MIAVRYRYPLFLQQEDWRLLVEGFTRRVKRFRGTTRLAQVGRLHDAVREAEGDAYEDNDGDWKYVLYLLEQDYAALRESVGSCFADIEPGARARIEHELRMALGDARPV